MQTLARHPFFQDAGFDLAAFDRRCSWRRADTGEVLVDFEDPSTDAYVLLAGDVRVLVRTAAGKEVVLDELRGGHLFGELAAIDGVRRSANVTALTRCELAMIPAPVFREAVYTSPVLAERIARLLATRVRDLNSRLMERAVLEVRHRLYAELLRLSHPRGPGKAERVLSPPPFHHVLAARIGCRREQVTRELSSLTVENLVARTRGALVLLRPEVLAARVDEAMRAES